MDLGYPIVPIYFEGNQRLSQGGSLVTRKGESTAHIHPQISTHDWTLENLDEKIEDVRSRYLQWAADDFDMSQQEVDV
jgi:hypothetical protein